MPACYDNRMNADFVKVRRRSFIGMVLVVVVTVLVLVLSIVLPRYL